MRDPSASLASFKPRLAVGVLLALTLIVHGRNVFHDFLDWDDNTLLVQNPMLNPVSAEHLGKIWTEPVEGLYTPLAYSAWSAVASVARVDSPDANGVTLNPMAFHLLNVLLHAACVLIVFNVLLRLPLPSGERAGVRGETLHHERRSSADSSLTPAPLHTTPTVETRFPPHLISPRRGEGPMQILPAMMGAAVFAVHPLQVEAVAWISGMNNLLAAVCSLACVAAYLRFATRGEKKWYAVAMGAFMLALFSKPTALVTPGVIVAIDALIPRRPWRQIALAVAPLAVLAVPFVIVGRLVQPAGGSFAPPMLQRVIVAGDAIGFYLCKLVWPWPLLIDYGRRPAMVAAAGPAVPHLAALALVVILVIALWNRHRAFAGAIAVFVAGMALVLGLVPFDFQAFSTVADRYAYLSMLGVAIAVAAILSRVRQRAVQVVAAAAILAFSLVSVRQIGLWSDDDTLAGYTMKHNPTSLAAHMILACSTEHRGDLATAEAIYRDGLVTFPDDGGLNRDLGSLLFNSRRPNEAIPYFQKAFLLQTRFDPKLVNNLGSALLDTGHVNEAIDAFKLVTEQAPNHLNAHINLGHAYMMVSRLDLAEPPLRRALQIDPNSASAQRWMAVLQDGKSRSAPR